MIPAATVGLMLVILLVLYRARPRKVMPCGRCQLDPSEHPNLHCYHWRPWY